MVIELVWGREIEIENTYNIKTTDFTLEISRFYII